MKAHLTKILQIMLLFGFIPLQGAENNDGSLGPISEGTIKMELVVNHGVTAGFLRTNLGDPEDEFQNVETYRHIDSLMQNSQTTVPLCIISPEGGSYSIDSFEIPGMENTLRSEFGSTVPIEVIVGDGKEDQSRFKAVTENCNAEAAIPITLKTKNPLSGREVGRMNGQFNLLVKVE